MIRHLASVAEIVADYDAALAFYRDTLGLEVKELGPGYAVAELSGVLHFGIWSRASAAEATFGDRAAADRVPLGVSLGFEVDALGADTEQLESRGVAVVQAPKKEPWGQITSRFLSPGGSLLEFSEMPGARRISQEIEAGGDD